MWPRSSVGFVLLLPCVGLAQTFPGDLPAHEKEAYRAVAAQQGALGPTCDTVYLGPLDGDWDVDAFWSTGIPTAEKRGCIPDRAGNAVLSGANVVGQPDPNIPPTTMGACCLGSSCVENDYFNCRELGGNFVSGVVACTASVCTIGSCCTDAPSCTDDNGAGGAMDDSLCISLGGIFVGGANCDATDPCQRFRIPPGFEIIEVAPGTESQEHGAPALNNCGEIIFYIGPFYEPTTELRRYDNTFLLQFTTNNDSDAFPAINDRGEVSWNQGVDGRGRGTIVTGDPQTPTYVGPGLGDSGINNLNHIAWHVHVSVACPGPRRDAIYFYDGTETDLVYDDGLSNQSARVNDLNEIIWTRYHSPCGGGFGDWNSRILLYSQGTIATPPPASEIEQGPTPQLPALTNTGPAVWQGSLGVEYWDRTDDPVLLVPGSAGVPTINDRGEIAYSFKDPTTPYILYLRRSTQLYHISSELDLPSPYIDNIRPDMNDAGEIAWWWHPNGELTPSGTRYMRRIRNGDVDFDGDVDGQDFLPWPGCFTGSVETDGLCECRFLDIDHDRDIDFDDFALFLRRYSGPLEDCNGNGVMDLEELLAGAGEGITNYELRMTDEQSRDREGADQSEPRVASSGRVAQDFSPGEVESNVESAPPPLKRWATQTAIGNAATDCNLNAIPDSCDLSSGFSPDSDSDGIPDECCTWSLTNVASPLVGDAWVAQDFSPGEVESNEESTPPPLKKNAREAPLEWR